MGRCRCDPVSVAGCQCSASDSDCISISGSGTAANPFVWTQVIDPDPDNLYVCGVDGVLVALPEVISNPPRVSVIRITALTVPTSDITTVPFTDVLYDVGGFWDISDAENLVVPVDGLYLMQAHCTWNPNAADGVRLVARKSTGLAVAADTGESPSAPGQHGRQNVNRDFEMLAGQAYSLEVYHNTGSTSYLEESGTLPAAMELRWVAPLEGTGS